MDQVQITFLSYVSGCILYAALLPVFLRLWAKRAIPAILLAPVIFSIFWAGAYAANYGNYSIERPILVFLEASRYSAWITAIVGTLHFSTRQFLSFKFRLAVNLVWIIAMGSTGLMVWLDSSLAYQTDFLVWMNLFLAIFCLVCVEQLYRNTSESRLIKLLAISISALFVYDIYLFTDSLIFNVIDQGLWQARGIINGVIALLVALGTMAISRQGQRSARLSISRPVVFYTTSLTGAGTFLTLMAIGGLYVNNYGGQWGTLLQVILLFFALLAIAVVFLSRTVQSRLNVWINKNFFHHKYDYRVEWLKLINALSRPTTDGNFNKRALDTVASIFKSPQAGLWLKQRDHFAPACINDLKLPDTNLSVSLDEEFCKVVQENEWVFSPDSPEQKATSPDNDILPQWMLDIENIWLVLPLLTETELIGFVILTKPHLDSTLTWEDLDLLKTVGRQVASYIEKHESAELLAEAKQFDAFNKLTAFIMHDLKNLIAQQGLVVENAAKHKENPAFVEDAIRTIDNSVGRMSTLLKKLQQNEPSEFRSLSLQKVLMDAIKKSQEQKPVPSLRIEQGDMNVNADLDRLIMTVTHIIKNAQEATASTGFVDVTLRQEGNNAIIAIEDNGTGMDEDFVQNRLFKPFVTTKSGKGMGIGVYQTKEYISSLGGRVEVESTLGVGTSFLITLPII